MFSFKLERKNILFGMGESIRIFLVNTQSRINFVFFFCFFLPLWLVFRQRRIWLEYVHRQAEVLVYALPQPRATVRGRYPSRIHYWCALGFEQTPVVVFCQWRTTSTGFWQIFLFPLAYKLPYKIMFIFLFYSDLSLTKD